MKKFFAFTLFVVSSAFAAEVTVLDVPAGRSHAYDNHDVRFIIDQEAGTASAHLSVSREHETCRPSGDYGMDCTTWYTNLLSKKAPIDGMKVVDKQVTFEDRIDCGKMGVSRIFKVPTFYMTGQCRLDVERVKVDGEKRIIVKLITAE